MSHYKSSRFHSDGYKILTVKGQTLPTPSSVSSILITKNENPFAPLLDPALKYSIHPEKNIQCL